MKRARFLVELDIDPVPTGLGLSDLQLTKKYLEHMLKGMDHYRPSVSYAEGTGGYYSEYVVCAFHEGIHPLWPGCVDPSSPLLWKGNA